MAADPRWCGRFWVPTRCSALPIGRRSGVRNYEAIHERNCLCAPTPSAFTTSPNQRRIQGNFGIQNLGNGAAGLGLGGKLLEFGLIRAGHLGF